MRAILIIVIFMMSLSFSFAQEHNNICMADSLHNLAIRLFNNNRDEKNALSLEKFAHAILVNSQPIDSVRYYNSIKSLAEYYSNSNENYAELAIKYYSEAIDYCRRNYGNDTVDYYVMQSELGYLLLTNEMNKGQELILNSMQNINKIIYPKEYALSLLNYSWFLYYSDRLSEAREYAIEARNILQSYSDTEEYTYALHQIAWYSYFMGEYEYAIPIQEECVKKRESLFGTRHNYYLNSLNLLSGLYEEVGDVRKSIPIYKQILVSYAAISGKENVDYSCSLNNLCETYTSIGDYANALPLAKEALSIDLKLATKGEYDRLDVSYNNVAYCYNHLGLNDSTICYAKKALEVALNKFGDSSIELVIPYNNLAYYLIESHQLDAAKTYASKALSICQSDTASNLQLLVSSLSLMGVIAQNEGDISKAIKLGENAKALCEEKYGKNNELYINVILHLVECYFESGNYKMVEMYLEEYTSYVRSSILKDFLIIPPIKRIKFWETHEKLLCNDILRYASKIQSPNIARIAYDACLISKSLLLSTEQTFQSIAYNSGDSETIRLVSRLDELCIEYNELSLSDGLKDYKQAQILEDDIISNYNELLKRSNIFSNVMNQYRTTSSDVSNNLPLSAISVEFARYSITNDYMLVAVICEPNGSFTIIPLCKESEFSNYNADNQLHEHIYSLIWDPILSKYKDYNNIYFSPAGIIYSISIENIKLAEGEMIGEQYNIYRLSSTREIVLNNKSNDISKAVVYGGLEYESDIRNSLIVTKTPHHLYSQSLWNTGKKKYLKGTQLEYASIISNLSEIDKIEVLGFSGSSGTESSFKQLSSSNINLLHIATHGFYNPIEYIDNSTIKAKYDSFNFALLRSGLILSGANNYLNEGNMFNYRESEGVLTSQEISELDFTTTDLVVLSACESGLGDISNNGVWGLQRGFKKAGVNGIIMSLWEVDDMATALFMSEFYSKYLKGEAKQLALISAQKYVMNYSKEYSNPYYWAAFILLDGLN